MDNKNERDEWETPQYLYDWLDSIYHFKIDLCATDKNSKSTRRVIDMLSMFSLDGNAFMNPPFSKIGPFIKKAWELSSEDSTVVCLVPNSIKTCKYLDFLDIMEGENLIRMWNVGVRWLDISRRTQFKHPNKEIKGNNVSFGCSLLILNNPNNKGVL